MTPPEWLPIAAFAAGVSTTLFGVVWKASHLVSRVETLADELRKTLLKLDAQSAREEEHITRLEERDQRIAERITVVETKLDMHLRASGSFREGMPPP